MFAPTNISETAYDVMESLVASSREFSDALISDRERYADGTIATSYELEERMVYTTSAFYSDVDAAIVDVDAMGVAERTAILAVAALATRLYEREMETTQGLIERTRDFWWSAETDTRDDADLFDMDAVGF